MYTRVITDTVIDTSAVLNAHVVQLRVHCTINTTNAINTINTINTIHTINTINTVNTVLNRHLYANGKQIRI